MFQSNGNFPPFHPNVPGPAEHFNFNPRASYPSSNGSQQYMPRAPRSVQRNVRKSPPTSVRSVVTAPAQRFHDRPTSQQPRRGAIDDRIDPSLPGVGTHLAPSGHVAQAEFNIERGFRDEAWNGLHLASAGNSEGRSQMLQANTNYKIYPPGPGSAGSGAPRSDSGVDSGFYSQSVISMDANRLDQSRMSQSINQQIGDINVRSAASNAPDMVRVLPDQMSHTSRVSSRSGKPVNDLECPQCHEIMKCKSDYKKHILRHDKPFMCDVLGCKRTQGFTTTNDLDRHKKSVHRIGYTKKSYRCASETCRNKEKIWPRLDNFKQHLGRMHKEEDHDDLIKRSLNNSIPTQQMTTSELLSVDPIDTMLVGMEKPFSAQSNYEPIVEAELRVEHDLSQWPVGLMPSNDPLNFYQTSNPMPASDQQYVPMERRRSNSFQKSQNQQSVPLMHRKSSRTPQASCQSSQYNGRQDLAKDVTPLQRPAVGQQKDQQRKISNEPQTKAQQQRQALKKLSKAVSNKMEDSSVDLEKLLLNILVRTAETDEGEAEQPENEGAPTSNRGQGDRSNKVFLTKSEAIKAAQMISNLIRQSPGSAYSQPRKSSQGFTANNKVCSICGYAVARDCDLKKHMKRHAKPYGCTYPKCHKRFGAKSDWKRHENSQHFQLEAFRCRLPSPTGTICGEHFFRIEHFKRHLEAQHNVSKPEDREQEAKARRIGKNCQQQFWCGFHNEIVVLKEKRNAAWDERFDHIAHHFEKDKKSIEEWVCVEENKTKKELLRELDRYVFDDEEERGKECSVPSPPAPLPVDVSVTAPMQSHVQQEPPVNGLLQIVGNKRRASGEPSDTRSHKRQRDMHQDPEDTQGILRYCCGCGDGPCNSSVSSACLMCAHTFCHGCPADA